MPAERVAMRQAREIIRLKFSAGLPTREIARRLGVAASTVRGTLRRFEGSGLGWPLPNGMSAGDLEAALYANHGTKLEVAAHYYSVPHRFARAEVDARLTAQTVEIFLKGERIAAHMRMSGNHKHTTVAEHMPSSHRRYAGWTIERIRADARLIGPATAALCELILEQRPHPEQGFRACLGIVRLAGPYGAERLEAAAERAIDIGARTYGSVKSILNNHLDRRPAHKRATDATPILHSNIRGPRYYN